MRYLVILILSVLGFPALAQDWEDQRRFGSDGATQTLRVLSSTDTDIFAPVVQSFLTTAPGLAVDYYETSTADLDRVFRDAPDQFDVVISSAMDLQLKLANDGLARPLSGLVGNTGSQWRQSLFGFTLEPASVVINRAAFEGRPVPETRQIGRAHV